MKTINPIQSWLYSLGNWADFRYPATPVFPSKPFHPDGDKFYTTLPTKRVDNSDAIIAHMKKGGKLIFDTPTTKPDYAGKVDGIFLNRAVASDPQFTISQSPGKHNLWVKTYYSAPYGTKIRIPNDAIVQGYPMNGYSDSKMHIYDSVDNRIIEIQYCEQISPLVPILGWLHGGGYTCHGVTIYNLKDVSTSPAVYNGGASVSGVPLSYLAPLYDDLQRGFVQMLGMATPGARKGQTVWPAAKSDGPSSDADAVVIGQILRLKQEVADKYLADPKVGTMCKTMIKCMAGPGIMVVDTGGNNAVGITPDNRYKSTDLAPLQSLTLDNFEVWIR